MAAAEVYRDTSTHQASHGLKLVEQLKPQQGMKVLDLGCGTGYLASVWADRVGPTGRVIGVDPDASRIRLASEQYGDRDNLTFCKGSTEDFPQDEYDVVFSNCVLHWVEDKRTAFTNVYRNLRPGGRFGIIVAEVLMPILGRLTDMMREEQSKALYERLHYLPRSEYEDMAFSAGFGVELSVSLPRSMFVDAERMMSWWKGTSHGAFDTSFIDEPVLRKFREEHENKCIEASGPIVNMILVKL